MKVLVTGTTSGFGKAIAEKFAAEQHEVWITGRRKELLAALSTGLAEKYGTPVRATAVDVRDKQGVAQLADAVKARWAGVDLLVNNAGLALGLSAIDEGDTEDWDAMIDTNVKGLLYVTRALLPLMRQQKSGHIINIGSIAGKVVYQNGNVYCATKFAVDALTQAMRIDLLPHNIKVTAINPGMAETEFSLVRFKGDAGKASNTYAGFDALTAEDIAQAAFYCATLPAHVCINDMTITCTQQANSVYKVAK
ncbi:MAG: SDR family NAD(P)-dependent oxidoreductase [Edaphocola sp.]